MPCDKTQNEDIAVSNVGTKDMKMQAIQRIFGTKDKVSKEQRTDTLIEPKEEKPALQEVESASDITQQCNFNIQVIRNTI